MLAFVAGALVLILLALEHLISHRRWPVKTLSDADRSRVVRAPVDTTVRFLASLPRVPAPLPHDRRIAPHELTVYRVRARLGSVHKMLDGDFHVAIADPDFPASRMIVEIPAVASRAPPKKKRGLERALPRRRLVPGRSTSWPCACGGSPSPTSFRPSPSRRNESSPRP